LLGSVSAAAIEQSASLKTRPLISTDKTFYVAKEIAGCTLNGEYVAVVVCPPWRGSAVFHFMLHFTATAEHLHRASFSSGSKGARRPTGSVWISSPQECQATRRTHPCFFFTPAPLQNNNTLGDEFFHDAVSAFLLIFM
jgi:hypothetical protein